MPIISGISSVLLDQQNSPIHLGLWIYKILPVYRNKSHSYIYICIYITSSWIGLYLSFLVERVQWSEPAQFSDKKALKSSYMVVCIHQILTPTNCFLRPLSGAVLHSSREPGVWCPYSDFMDMLRHLLNCSVIIIHYYYGELRSCLVAGPHLEMRA